MFCISFLVFDSKLSCENKKFIIELLGLRKRKVLKGLLELNQITEERIMKKQQTIGF
jgi:hypothetical protein